MALNLTSLKTRFDALLLQLPTTVTIGSTDVTGTRTVLTRAKAYLPEGARNSYVFSIVIAVDDLPSGTAVRDLVTISSTEYRIIGMEQDAAGVAIRLDLADKYAEDI